MLPRDARTQRLPAAAPRGLVSFASVPDPRQFRVCSKPPALVLCCAVLCCAVLCCAVLCCGTANQRGSRAAAPTGGEVRCAKGPQPRLQHTPRPARPAPSKHYAPCHLNGVK